MYHMNRLPVPMHAMFLLLSPSQTIHSRSDDHAAAMSIKHHPKRRREVAGAIGGLGIDMRPVQETHAC
jgi:hypothetical protein